MKTRWRQTKSVDWKATSRSAGVAGKFWQVSRRLGELVAGTRTMERPHVNQVHWRTRWLAPAIGIAAVLAVWFAMRPPWRTPERSASEVPPEVIVAEGPKQNPGP